MTVRPEIVMEESLQPPRVLRSVIAAMSVPVIVHFAQYYLAPVPVELLAGGWSVAEDETGDRVKPGGSDQRAF